MANNADTLDFTAKVTDKASSTVERISDAFDDLVKSAEDVKSEWENAGEAAEDNAKAMAAAAEKTRKAGEEARDTAKRIKELRQELEKLNTMSSRDRFNMGSGFDTQQISLMQRLQEAETQLRMMNASGHTLSIPAAEPSGGGSGASVAAAGSAARNTRAEIDALNASQAANADHTARMSGEFDKLRENMDKNTRAAIGFLGSSELMQEGLQIVYEYLVDVARASTEYEQAVGRISNAQKALGRTGGTDVGMTPQQIDVFAQSLESRTTAVRTQILDAANQLQLAGTVTGDAFRKVLTLAQDAVATGGGELAARVQQISDAIKDPGKNLRGLSDDLGLNIDQATEKLLAEAAKAGDYAKVQQEVLQRLQDAIGGAGAAQGAMPTTAAVQELTTSWEKLKVTMGDTDAFRGLLGIIQSVSDGTTDFLTNVMGGGQSGENSLQPLLAQADKLEEAMERIKGWQEVGNTTMTMDDGSVFQLVDVYAELQRQLEANTEKQNALTRAMFDTGEASSSAKLAYTEVSAAVADLAEKADDAAEKSEALGNRGASGLARFSSEAARLQAEADKLRDSLSNLDAADASRVRAQLQGISEDIQTIAVHDIGQKIQELTTTANSQLASIAGDPAVKIKQEYDNAMVTVRELEATIKNLDGSNPALIADLENLKSTLQQVAAAKNAINDVKINNFAAGIAQDAQNAKLQFEASLKGMRELKNEQIRQANEKVIAGAPAGSDIEKLAMELATKTEYNQKTDEQVEKLRKEEQAKNKATRASESAARKTEREGEKREKLVTNLQAQVDGTRRLIEAYGQSDAAGKAMQAQIAAEAAARNMSEGASEAERQAVQDLTLEHEKLKDQLSEVKKVRQAVREAGDDAADYRALAEAYSQSTEAGLRYNAMLERQKAIRDATRDMSPEAAGAVASALNESFDAQRDADFAQKNAEASQRIADIEKQIAVARKGSTKDIEALNRELEISRQIIEQTAGMTPEQTRSIEQQLRTEQAKQEQLRKTNEMYSKQQTLMKDIGDTIADSLSDAIYSGESLMDVFKSMALQISKIGLDAYLLTPLKSAMGGMGGGGNPLGAIFSAIGGAFGGGGGGTGSGINYFPPAPKMARGGDFGPGPVVVGDKHGMENAEILFTKQPGTIFPDAQGFLRNMEKIGSGRGATNQNVINNITFSGVNPKDVTQRSIAQAGARLNLLSKAGSKVR